MPDITCSTRLDVHFVTTLTERTLFYLVARTPRPRLLINCARWRAMDTAARWAAINPIRGETRRLPPDVEYHGRHRGRDPGLLGQLGAVPEADWARIVAASP